MGPSTTLSSVSIHCKGILFDMDGILISSLQAAERSWAKWAVMRNVNPAVAVKTMHGRRAIETVAMLCPDCDPEAELKIIEGFEVSDTQGITALPGVLTLLRALPRESWTVVTSSTDRLTRTRMGVAGIPVPERLVSADSVTIGKPRPDPFLAGAALLGLRAEECVVFEDSASGVKAGCAAGCTVVATTFSQPESSLKAADYIVGGMTDVAVKHAAQGIVLRLSSLR